MTDILLVSGQSNASNNFYQAVQANMPGPYVSGYFTQSGASIGNWVDENGVKGVNWAPMLAAFDAAVASATVPINNIYFVWFQGEGDTLMFNNFEISKLYAQRLCEFIDCFNQHALTNVGIQPVYSLSQVWSLTLGNNQGYQTVRNANLSKAAADDCVTTFETMDLDRIDDVHLQNNVPGGSPGQLEAGNRAIAAIIEAINAKRVIGRCPHN